MESGQFRFIIEQLPSGDFTDHIFVEFVRLFCSDTLWHDWELAETELFRTHLLRVSSRLAASVWEKITFQLGKFPWSIFSLLRDRSEEKVAEALQVPPCVCGDFGIQVFRKYDTADKVRSEEFFQLLSAIASVIQACTFSTERSLPPCRLSP